MASIVSKILVGLACASIGAIAADNTLGTWKLNMAKSTFTPSAPVKSLAQTREAAVAGVKMTATGEQANGQAIKASYTAKYDGSERQ